MVAGFGEHVGHKTVADMLAHVGQDAQAKFFTPGVECQPRQTDEGIAPPGVKPGVSGKHGGPPRGRGDAKLLASGRNCPTRPPFLPSATATALVRARLSTAHCRASSSAQPPALPAELLPRHGSVPAATYTYPPCGRGAGLFRARPA